MVRPWSKNGRREITQNSIEVDAETKESTRKTEEKLDEKYKEGHERKKPKWRPVGRQEAMESRCRTRQKDVLKPIYTHTHQFLQTTFTPALTSGEHYFLVILHLRREKLRVRKDGGIFLILTSVTKL